MQERVCKAHLRQIVFTDDKNFNQCETCFKNECFNKMLKIEKVIKLSNDILTQSKDNREKILTLKTIELMNKYKKAIQSLFNERKLKYKQQLQYIEDQKYKKFEYQRISEQCNMRGCYSFAFNQDFTQIFIGQYSDIKIFEFKNGEIKRQLRELRHHKDDIYHLIYFNTSKTLISGSCDSTIAIWNQDQNGRWKLYQILEGHQLFIKCLIINEDEDILISGAWDKQIKIWVKTKVNWSCQQTIKTQLSIESLSLSKSEKKLIACGHYQILVIEYSSDQQQWIISEEITTNTLGQHLLFLSDNRFAYQGCRAYLEIYLYDQEKKKFVIDKQIKVQAFYGQEFTFPCKYIEQKNIIIIKNDKYLNCFGLDQEQNLILKQTIYLEKCFQGNISNDGQFIIIYQTMDWSQRIDVLKLQYLE